MTYFIFTVFFLVAVTDITRARPADNYKNYSNVNVDEILQNERLLKNYFNCLLDKGRCNAQGRDLKKIVPDALENGCSKCSAGQRKAGIKVIRFLITNKPDWWNELAAKYDPSGKYLKKYREEARRENINL
nr:chemosensory protein 8 [Pachyrhinus yasumatsui]